MIRWKTWLAAFAVVLSVPRLAGTETLSAQPAPANPTAAARYHGQEAVRHLGDRLPEVAAAYGMTPAALRDELVHDVSIFVDGGDRLGYLDAAPRFAPATEDPTVPPGDAFLLHSNPGAARVLYLDFDGHMLSGTVWNDATAGDCYAEPFDFDGLPGTFSASERNVVAGVWARVAEDFAAFDIDVTTEDPGDDAIGRDDEADTVFGSRALVTRAVNSCANGLDLYQSICPETCGGVAYLGVFDAVGADHDLFQPALIFQNGVGSNAKTIAEAVSHETGHTLGLSHDGTRQLPYYEGHGSWAPIMGVGYGKAITQWSRGEYSGADQKEDDFVVAGRNGLGLRADDHGNSTANATPLSGAAATVGGVIGTAGDVDAFTVTTSGGPATFVVKPWGTGPDLDAKLTVVDPAGRPVVSVNPESGSTSADNAYGLGAAVTLDLVRGTYTLLVQGVGAGDPLRTGYSSYGSVGQYQLVAEVTSDGNSAPRPVVSAEPTGGPATLPVSFRGSASVDPDGDVLSYQWSFGDGTTSTEADPSHQYVKAGAYTASLTVTDSRGLSTTVLVPINVKPRTMDVADLAVTGTVVSRGAEATATVAVRDIADQPVSGAKVSVSWYVGSSTKAVATKTVATATNGVAIVPSPVLKASPGETVRACVVGLSLRGVPWDPTQLVPATASDCSTWVVG